MQLLVFKSLWGMTGSLEANIAQIAEAGYDGVEAWTPSGQPLPAKLRQLVEQYDLELILASSTFDTEAIEATLRPLADLGPLKINLQGGRDCASRDDNLRFFETALRVEDEIGVPVCHETHRLYAFFTPWQTADLLRQFDSLKITADYSHWVNVCERLPDDQAEALALANSRAHHIHGRVGYPEGPQVPDPSAPEYADVLAWHERHWLEIRQHHAERGDALLTLTPEYGPPLYLHTLPHTHVPVADLWQVCLWAMQRARETLG